MVLVVTLLCSHFLVNHLPRYFKLSFRVLEGVLLVIVVKFNGVFFGNFELMKFFTKNEILNQDVVKVYVLFICFILTA